MADWNLFIDDIRETSYVQDGREYQLARSMAEACALISRLGLPKHIAFDHDLGWEDLVPFEGSSIIAPPADGKEMPSGYDFAKWLVQLDIDGVHEMPQDFSWSIHSSNPVGAANINGILTSYLKFKYNKE